MIEFQITEVLINCNLGISIDTDLSRVGESESMIMNFVALHQGMISWYKLCSFLQNKLTFVKYLNTMNIA